MTTTGTSRKEHAKIDRKVLVKRVAAAILCVAALALAFHFGRAFFKGETLDDAYYTTYICTETGKVFRHKNVLGETQPIYSPHSGKNTGMPAEACYWTADGSAKDKPTWVLLNEELGKSGPTFCPDCGRLVVGHNPHPGPGVRPPPTQAEFAARSSVAPISSTGQP